MKTKVKKGDTVRVLSGSGRGLSGKVLAVYPKEERVIVEGVNVVKRRRRARRAGEKGQVVEVTIPIHISNVRALRSEG